MWRAEISVNTCLAPQKCKSQNLCDAVGLPFIIYTMALDNVLVFSVEEGGDGKGKDYTTK